MAERSIPANFSPDSGTIPSECAISPLIERRSLLGGELRQWSGPVQTVRSPCSPPDIDRRGKRA